MSLRTFAKSIFFLGLLLITLGSFFFYKSRNYTISDEKISIEQVATEQDTDYKTLIKEKYNISIVTKGIESYSINSHPVIEITEDENNYLQELYRNLELYPTNFFKELTAKIPLSIYLVKTIDNTNITGATDVTNINAAIMTIATEFDIADTLHHETYHFAEDYMTLNGVDFSNWNKTYNNNYKYGEVNMDLVFTTSKDCNNTLFTMDYGQTDEYEDRASVFETLMYENNTISCYNDHNTILWKKADRIAKELDKHLGSVTSNKEYWERFIY